VIIAVTRDSISGMRTVSILFVLLLSGCQEKMGVEKRAEELAKQAASAKASASASAAAPDPHEEKYAAARKAILERAKAQMAAHQKIYQGVTEEERQAFRSHFAPTKEGEKEADEISKEAAFAGKQGMTIKRYDITGDQLDPKITLGTVDVFVEESQRGKERCTIYKLDFAQFGNEWRRTARRDFRIVACTDKP
jgi:hypothetical protein